MVCVTPSSMFRTQQEGQGEGDGHGHEQGQWQEQAQEGKGDLMDTNNNNNSNNNNDSNNDNNNSNNKDAVTAPSPASGVRCGKYQLRPRALQSRHLSDSEWLLPQDSLRSSKPRPPPLSRYRRKTANARERYRMRQINRAFESLRCALPAWVVSRRAAADMTKITTLRLASAYIRSLHEALHDGDVPWGSDSPLATPAKKEQGEGGPPVSQDADLLTLLYTDATVLGDNLGGLSGLAPLSESEAVALLLGGPIPLELFGQISHIHKLRHIRKSSHWDNTPHCCGVLVML